MATRKVLTELQGIVFRSTNVLKSFGSGVGRSASLLRLAVGDIQANLNRYLLDGTFAYRLMTCYRIATDAGISVDWLDNVLNQLVSETPTTIEAVSVVQNSILFALAQDGRILAKTEFTSREDVERILKRMKAWFDTTIELAAGEKDNLSYAALINLAGAITRYLADTARPLPRMLSYQMTPMPALTLSQRIYYDGSRDEELVAENGIINPCFCPVDIRALSG